MEKFVSREGLVVPLDRANVDTDAIIPKQFLKSIKRTGFGPNLFDQWRYLDTGEPGMDNARRPLNPDFSLNQPRYRGASPVAHADELTGAQRRAALEFLQAMASGDAQAVAYALHPSEADRLRITLQQRLRAEGVANPRLNESIDRDGIHNV